MRPVFHPPDPGYYFIRGYGFQKSCLSFFWAKNQRTRILIREEVYVLMSRLNLRMSDDVPFVILEMEQITRTLIEARNCMRSSGDGIGRAVWQALWWVQERAYTHEPG
nr:hypothetical protein [Tanacetum cinerariifolium]